MQMVFGSKLSGMFKSSLFMLTVILLSGCAEPGAIRLPDVEISDHTLHLGDSRRKEEIQGQLPYGCKRLGKVWLDVKDELFSTSRIEYLKEKINTTFPGRFAELKVNRLQTCYAHTAISGATFAGISYALALAVESSNRGDDTDAVQTTIEFELDGHNYLATNAKTFTRGSTAASAFGNPKVIDYSGKSVVDAVASALDKIKNRNQ